MEECLTVGCRVELHDGTKGSVINKSGTWWYISLDNQAGIAKRQKGKLNVITSCPSELSAGRGPSIAADAPADSKLSAAFNEMIAREANRPWRSSVGKENAFGGELTTSLTSQRALTVALQLKREAVRVASEANEAILIYDKVMRLAEDLKSSEPIPVAKPKRAPLGEVKLSNNANHKLRFEGHLMEVSAPVAKKTHGPVVPPLQIKKAVPHHKNNTSTELESVNQQLQQWFKPRAAVAVEQQESCSAKLSKDSAKLAWILARTHGLHSGKPQAALPASTFKVIRELGHAAGAFGRVYRGVDTRNGQSVAVKKLTPSAGSGCSEEEIMLEICLLEALAPQCAQIVDYRGYYQVRRDYFLVLDLYDCSLWDHLFGQGRAKNGLSAMLECGKNGVVGPSKAMHGWACERHFITIEVAKALVHMHGAGSHGIMHRDLKPDNVLLGLDSKGGVKRVVLTDFGLSRTAWRNQNRRMSGDIGTVRYMSPEVMRGDTYGRPSDLWSFGVTVYELWTGLPAYEGLSEMQAEQSIMSLGRPGVRGYVNELRPLPSVFSLVDQCLIPQGRRIEAIVALEMLTKNQKSICEPVLQMGGNPKSKP